MAERKVLNKYFPPDFDPTNLARKTPWKEQKVVVRMMLPMNVQCKKCKEYMYRGTKFNTRKEDVEGESYLGIRLYRFYFKCLGCSQPFCLKTDPKNADYTCETGASRNFEPWRAEEKEKDAFLARKEEEEAGDAMKALENRTEESRQELDFLDVLSETREFNTKIEAADPEEALRKVGERHTKKEMALTLAENEQVKNAFARAAKRRQEEADERMLAERRAEAESDSFAPAIASSQSLQSSRPIFKSSIYKISFDPEKSRDKKRRKKSKKKDRKRKKKKKSGGGDNTETGSSKKQKTAIGSTDTSIPEGSGNGGGDNVQQTTTTTKKVAPNPLSLLSAYDDSEDSE